MQAPDRIVHIDIVLPLLLLAALAAGLAAETGLVQWSAPAPLASLSAPVSVILPAADIAMRPSGAFLKDGLAVSPPLGTVHVSELEIMREEVSATDYALCVAAQACPAPHPRHGGLGDIPATGVSYYDAVAYASWLSRQTGESWRLPSVAEWDRAADGFARDHGLEAAVADPNDPSALWLAQFDASSAIPRERALEPRGSGGRNRLGIADIDNAVWEWTSDCSSRIRLDGTGAQLSRVEVCSVRVLEGRHRMPMSAFIEDAYGGGCSMGVPPDNLGFRLVRDPGLFERLNKLIQALLPPLR